MVSAKEVLEIVRKHGPVLPADVKQEIEGNTITIGALLSQLTDDEEILMSHTKIGGSPVYYTEDQEEDLQELREHLDDKHQDAFDKLRDEEVLIDDDQPPVIRAALRDLKDFAIPLEADTGDDTKMFWKWYLTSDGEAEDLLENKLTDTSSETQEDSEQENAAEQESEDTEQDATEQESDDEQEDNAQKQEETQTTVSEVTEEAELEEVEDEFINEVRSFLREKEITILEEDIIRKGTEVDYVVDVPSAIGEQRYYCKAKSKKKCNDGDLSSAYIQGESKGLPVLFLKRGDMTQKAEEMLEEEFKSMTVLTM